MGNKKVTGFGDYIQKRRGGDSQKKQKKKKKTKLFAFKEFNDQKFVSEKQVFGRRNKFFFAKNTPEPVKLSRVSSKNE